MKEKSKNEYVRRSQKDYSRSFKLRVVQEIESEELSIYAAKRSNQKAQQTKAGSGISNLPALDELKSNDLKFSLV